MLHVLYAPRSFIGLPSVFQRGVVFLQLEKLLLMYISGGVGSSVERCTSWQNLEGYCPRHEKQYAEASGMMTYNREEFNMSYVI